MLLPTAVVTGQDKTFTVVATAVLAVTLVAVML
jgi:hypothetical protein